MRRLWWLVVPVLLAVIFHRFLFSFAPAQIRYVVGMTQAACSTGVLDRGNCDRAGQYLRQSFSEAGAEEFVKSERLPYNVYSRIWGGLYSYTLRF